MDGFVFVNLGTTETPAWVCADRIESVLVVQWGAEVTMSSGHTITLDYGPDEVMARINSAEVV